VSRPRLLDLFCGAGGAAMGYHRAGFDVVGVDIAPQPRYPFEFHQGDALTYPLDGFDAIHASPPCQRWSSGAKVGGPGAKPREHPDLIAPLRPRLVGTGVAFVIENVMGAPLIDPIMLCGRSFGIRRHRLFEIHGTPFFLVPPDQCEYGGVLRGELAGVYGNGSRQGGFGCRWGRVPDGLSIRQWWAKCMDIDWMARHELSQAIPPAYTEWIGAHLIDHLRRRAA
jgi:DNA (cytosine-5)-methyltransferase 1